MSAANSNAALVGAVAAAGLMSAPAAAESPASGDDGLAIPAAASLAAMETEASAAKAADGPARPSLAGETRESLDEAAAAHSALGGKDAPPASDTFAGGHTASTTAPAELLHGTDAPAQSEIAASALIADAVAMPSAAMVLPVPQGAANNRSADAKTSGEVARVLADALGGGDRPQTLDALLDALPGNPHGPGAALAIASPVMADAGHLAMFSSANVAFTDALAVHHDAPPLV